MAKAVWVVLMMLGVVQTVLSHDILVSVVFVVVISGSVADMLKSSVLIVCEVICI